ncbi:hypothetical protein OSTOST_23576, partial [Ostertagia ostertagi]
MISSLPRDLVLGTSMTKLKHDFDKTKESNTQLRNTGNGAWRLSKSDMNTCATMGVKPSRVNTCLCQTPVIGGTCRLGTADVQIGGKQTQFFLKCEATSDSAAGDGVWVVKSRAATSPSTSSTGTTTSSFTVNQAIPVENSQPQQHPKLMRKQNAPNIC